MKVLSMDTTTKSATVAVTEDGVLLGEFTLNSDKPHSQKIMPLAEDLLKELGLTPDDIDLYACANGPGSFTGLRIGTAAIQGFSQATGKPSVGVSTLEAMCETLRKMMNDCICPLIDAKREQVYYSLYKGESEMIAPSMENIDTVLAQIACLNKKTIFVGDGAEIFRDKILSASKDFLVCPTELNVNNAVGVALLAQKKFEKKEVLQKPFPEYLIKSYADDLK